MASGGGGTEGRERDDPTNPILRYDFYYYYFIFWTKIELELPQAVCLITTKDFVPENRAWRMESGWRLWVSTGSENLG